MVDLIYKYIYCVEWLKVISIAIIKMTDGKLCTMNLIHLMNNINIYVNSECIECSSYTECYTEFIHRHANYKKKKNCNTHCFTKVFDSRVNLISLRSDIDFGNHPNRTNFTDLFKNEIKHFKKIFLKLQ